MKCYENKKKKQQLLQIYYVLGEEKGKMAHIGGFLDQ